MAVARGLPGGAGDVPLRARPDARVPGVHLHRELRRVLRLGQGDRPGDVRGDPGAGGRGPLGGGRRLVGRARLQHPVGRVVRPPRPVLASAGSRRSWRDGHGRLQRGSRSGTTGCCPSSCAARAWTRTCSCAPARTRSGLPSPVFWWESPDGSRVLHDAPAARVLLAAGGPGLPPRQVAGPAAGPVRRDDGVLRRRQPRRRADAGEPGVDPGARCVTLDAPSRPQHAGPLLRPGPRAWHRRHPRRPRRPPAPRGRLLLGPLGDQALEPPRGAAAGCGGGVVRGHQLGHGRGVPTGRARPRRGRPCCSTSSTTSSRARPSSRPTRRRATSWARHRRSRPAPTTWASSH